MAAGQPFNFYELIQQEKGRLDQRIDNIDGFTEIRGFASRGTADDEAAWLLMKTRIVDGLVTEVEYADGAKFTQTWDGRVAAFSSGNGSGGGGDLAIPAVRLTTGAEKFSEIDAASSGQNTVVAAVTGKKIRVLSYVFIASAAVTVEWRTGASTALTGAMDLAASAGISAPWNPAGQFETTSGAALTVNLGSAVSIDGHLTYIEV